MVAALFHRPHETEGDWTEWPQFADDGTVNEDVINWSCVMDYGRGKRDLRVDNSAGSFPELAQMMMDADPAKATAALVAAIAGEYPLPKYD